MGWELEKSEKYPAVFTKINISHMSIFSGSSIVLLNILSCSIHRFQKIIYACLSSENVLFAVYTRGSWGISCQIVPREYILPSMKSLFSFLSSMWCMQIPHWSKSSFQGSICSVVIVSLRYCAKLSQSASGVCNSSSRTSNQYSLTHCGYSLEICFIHISCTYCMPNHHHIQSCCMVML